MVVKFNIIGASPKAQTLLNNFIVAANKYAFIKAIDDVKRKNEIVYNYHQSLNKLETYIARLEQNNAANSKQ